MNVYEDIKTNIISIISKLEINVNDIIDKDFDKNRPITKELGWTLGFRYGRYHNIEKAIIENKTKNIDVEIIKPIYLII